MPTYVSQPVYLTLYDIPTLTHVITVVFARKQIIWIFIT